LDVDAVPPLAEGIRLRLVPAAAIARADEHVPAAIGQPATQTVEVAGADDVVGVKVVVEDGDLGSSLTPLPALRERGEG
jgi:hypothetical protein